MAYQFADGFDNYGNNYTMTAGYPFDTVSGAVTVITTDVRFTAPGSLPGGCLSAPQNTYVRKNLTGNPATVIVNVGFKATALPASGAGSIIDFWDSGNFQACLALNSNGALQFYHGNGLAPGGGGVNTSAAIGTLTANNTIIAGTWYGLAMQITFANGTGTASLYINGSATPAINSTGLVTIGTANAYATQVSIGNVNNNITVCRYDDFAVIDSTGVFLTSLFGGDARIITKMPSGAGFYTNWTPTGLASNFQNAAVQPPSLADYNANNTAATKDSYATQVASLGVAPFFVLARASLERDDAATHTPSLFVRSGATDSSGVVTPALTSSYAFYDAIFQNDPATAAAWTGTGADNAQVGVIEG